MYFVAETHTFYVVHPCLTASESLHAFANHIRLVFTCTCISVCDGYKDCFHTFYHLGINASCIFAPSGQEDSRFSFWDYIASEHAKLTKMEIECIRNSFPTNKDRLDHVVQKLVANIGAV